MSLVIAYFLIGAIMVSGLYIERWSRFDLGPGWVTSLIAMVFVFAVSALLWPSLLSRRNMEVSP